MEENSSREGGPNRQPLKTPSEEKPSQEIPQEPKRYPTSQVPKVEDALINKLWEDLKQGKLEAQTNKQPPLKEIDFDKKPLVLELRSKFAERLSLKKLSKAPRELSRPFLHFKENMKQD